MEALILIVGDDALTERVCAELVTSGARVRVVAEPDSDDALEAAGVAGATSLLGLSNDDERNLAAGLRARMLNPRIRVVLRQFSPKIGRKIEQNLPDSTVLSIAAHSAATFAGAALDPGCFFAIRFPEADGEFVGFTHAAAHEFGVAGLSVASAEARLGGRIVALRGHDAPSAETPVEPDDDVVLFAPVAERRPSVPLPDAAASEQLRAPVTAFVQRSLRAFVVGLRVLNPILRTVLLGALVFYSLTLLFFHFALHDTWADAAFDVAETMTNAGFGDASVAARGPQVTAGAIVAMIGGTVFTSIFIGYVSSTITRAQWTALQGLRRIRAHGHFVVCGAGRTGGAVVNLLTAKGKHVVVIDSHPDPGLVGRSREGSIDVLTGDATHEDVLELCDIPHAAAVLALTNSDPGNLEIALAARAMRADVPLVVRMENRTFAKATTELFGIATFSPAALTAPAFAGLARSPGTIGRVRYGGLDRTIVSRRIDGSHESALPAGALPLAVWRDRALIPVRTADALQAGDVVLYAQPIDRSLC